jgi:putative redox protein
MAVTIDFVYEGDLHCTLTHGPSGSRFVTDAPTDNRGKDEAFSPTDLVGASMGSCILTTMGIVAADRGWSIEGARGKVTKKMGWKPRRHIARLIVEIALPAALDVKARTVLERSARSCPVEESLEERTVVDLSFRYV